MTCTDQVTLNLLGHLGSLLRSPYYFSKSVTKSLNYSNLVFPFFTLLYILYKHFCCSRFKDKEVLEEMLLGNEAQDENQQEYNCDRCDFKTNKKVYYLGMHLLSLFEAFGHQLLLQMKDKFIYRFLIFCHPHCHCSSKTIWYL